MRRRYFLASAAAGILRTSRASGANDTIRIACVGVRGRGGAHISGFGALAGVEVAALCDVDEGVLNRRVQEAEKAGRKCPKAFVDFRKVLDDKSIDAVAIATQNHNHALQTIWACQAGKDVYVEKPCSHNMFEARQVVAAARKYDRIVQQGSQNRSMAGCQEAVRQLREGVIGDVYMARGLCFKWRDTIKRTAEGEPPDGVHYDMWLGPAPKVPFTRNRFHYNWHWFWDYGNGDIGNQGIHELDKARWGLGVKYPVRVSSMGGHFMFDDDQETPNTQVATFEFDEGGKKKLLVFEVRHWISNHEAGAIGNLFYGSKGYMALSAGGFQTYIGKTREPGPAVAKAGPDTHFANFIQAVRSRKRTDLTSEIEEGAISTVLVHLANISYRIGRTVNFDPVTYSCPGDAEANKLFTRDYRAPYVVPAEV